MKRVTTSSSLPRAANQELGISWSECQTSLAPSKSTWAIPHASSNEVLCWTPRLFEYCTQFAPTEHCNGLCWSCGQGRSFPKGRWSIALWAPVTAWHNEMRKSQVHWHTFALSVTQPRPKASKRFPSSPRHFEENLQNVRSGARAGFCRASHAERSSLQGLVLEKACNNQLLHLFWERVFMAHRISAMDEGPRCKHSRLGYRSSHNQHLELDASSNWVQPVAHVLKC